MIQLCYEIILRTYNVSIYSLSAVALTTTQIGYFLLQYLTRMVAIILYLIAAVRTKKQNVVTLMVQAL